MATLAKAFLVELLGNTKDSKPNPKRDPIPVQFNPTSLHLQMTNNEEGGKSRQRQAEQSTGAATTTLSLDLVFDSADEGSITKDLHALAVFYDSCFLIYSGHVVAQDGLDSGNVGDFEDASAVVLAG